MSQVCMLNYKNRQRGFTLLEMLLSISLFSIIVLISIPPLVSLTSSSSLADSDAVVIELMRSAQLNAINGVNDSRWGVFISADEVVQFSGDSYGSRDVNYDVVIPLSFVDSVGGTTEFVFEKNGDPVSGGVVTLFSLGETLQITVNDYGGITQ